MITFYFSKNQYGRKKAVKYNTDENAKNDVEYDLEGHVLRKGNEEDQKMALTWTPEVK